MRLDQLDDAVVVRRLFPAHANDDVAWLETRLRRRLAPAEQPISKAGEEEQGEGEQPRGVRARAGQDRLRGGLRFLYFYLSGEGDGHIQSVVFASMFVLLFTAFLPIAGIRFPWVTWHWIAGLVLTGSEIKSLRQGGRGQKR